MANRTPWPLNPLYISLTERDWYRKNIKKLLDLNFGKVWRYYLRLRYVGKHLQHRISILEVRDEEKIDLTPYKIRGISITRNGYYAHAVDLIKFFYINNSNIELTQSEIEKNTFRFRERDGSFRIKDTIDNLPPPLEDDNSEIEKKTTSLENVNLKEISTYKSKDNYFQETIDKTIKKLAKTVKINTGFN